MVPQALELQRGADPKCVSCGNNQDEDGRGDSRLDREVHRFSEFANSEGIDRLMANRLILEIPIFSVKDKCAQFFPFILSKMSEAGFIFGFSFESCAC